MKAEGETGLSILAAGQGPFSLGGGVAPAHVGATAPAIYLFAALSQPAILERD